MASISDMLVQSSLQGSQQAGESFTSGLKAGADLASTIEAAQQRRAQIEQQKEQLYMQKVDKVMEAVEKGAGFKDKIAQNNYFKNYVPSMIKAFKVDDFFNPELMGFMQSPEVRDKLVGLRLDIQDKINNGELKGAQILQYAKSKVSPEELAQLDTESLLEQQKFAAQEAGKSARAETVADAAAGRAKAAREDAGQVELSKKVADKYANYTAGGGRAGMQSSLTKLSEVAKALETGEVETGGVSTKIPWIKSDDAQSMLNPKMVQFKTDAQAALNNILRTTLGTQFTEQEGIRVLNQVWDDRQPPKVNAKRVQDKIKELRANVRDSESEFRRFNYLQEPEKKKGAFESLSPAAQELIRKRKAGGK